MASNHVLYLSYDGLTDPLGQSQILPYLCGLSAAGYSISIISFEKPGKFVSEKSLITDICLRNNLHWFPMVYHKTPPVLSTLFDLLQLRRKAIALHSKKNFSIVHCRSYITAIVGLWLKRNFDVKFIFDMRGFWSDERVEGGLWNLKNPIFKFVYRYFKKKERQFLTKADYIVSLTDNAKREIESWNIKVSPIRVIPTSVDLELFDPHKVTQAQKLLIRKTLDIKESDFVLLYLGSWGTWYHTSAMLDFFSKLKAVQPESKFLILSADRIDFSKYRYKEDVIHRTVRRNEVPLYISIVTASVFFILPTFSKKASSATKLGEILVMGVPVVTNKSWGDVDLLENRLKGFYATEIGDYEAAINFILEQEVDSGNIRQAAVENFALNNAIVSYHEVYTALTPPSTHPR
jgi:glycosyltransferase involved in cell wall biosynthesis